MARYLSIQASPLKRHAPIKPMGILPVACIGFLTLCSVEPCPACWHGRAAERFRDGGLSRPLPAYRPVSRVIVYVAASALTGSVTAASCNTP